MMTLEQPSHTAIDDFLDRRARELANEQRLWERWKPDCERIVKDLTGMGIEPVIVTDTIFFSFTGDAHRLAAVVRLLRVNGFLFTAARPVKGATSWSSFFNKENVDISFHLTFSSSTCRRVQVGTETVERPIYETRCGEEEITLPSVDGPINNLIDAAPPTA